MYCKYITIVITAIMTLFLCSCGTARKVVIRHSETIIKNTDTMRKAAENILKTWEFRSGLVRGYLGENMILLDPRVVEAMDDLDELASQYKNGQISDKDLGHSLGARVRIRLYLIKDELKKVAPKVLEYLPEWVF